MLTAKADYQESRLNLAISLEFWSNWHVHCTLAGSTEQGFPIDKILKRITHGNTIAVIYNFI